VLNRPRDENASALERLLAHVAPAGAAGRRIPIRQPGGTSFVDATDITWVEADGDHLRVHAGAAVYTVRDTLARFAAVLQPFNFVRVHRSALVNRDAVSAVKPVTKGGHYLILRNGARVRSGRRYRAAVKALVSAR
jgi:two-component system LytT family response regulator